MSFFDKAKIDNIGKVYRSRDYREVFRITGISQWDSYQCVFITPRDRGSSDHWAYHHELVKDYIEIPYSNSPLWKVLNK